MKIKWILLAIVAIIGILLYFMYSPRIGVVVKNQSDQTVDSVIVSNGINKVKFKKIGPKQEVKDKMYFSDEVKSDGGYGVKVYRAGKMEEQGFGYYTNGSPLSDQLIITILNDTVKATETGSGFINF
ncbi:MAG: hypothetical protein ACO1N9_08170 [Flavobacterium sp.]